MNIIKIDGKKPSQIAAEYNVSVWRVNQWAKENDVPCISFDRVTVDFYVFDKANEEKFANRRKESPGRTPVPKPPKAPGKPGRPRKEKPVDTGPKRPVGRPRTRPMELLDIVKRPRGRPRKS